jgi:hypothetical protein
MERCFHQRSFIPVISLAISHLFMHDKKYNDVWSDETGLRYK